MQQSAKRGIRFWSVPVTGTVIGLAYLVAFSVSGHPGDGLVGLGIMLAAVTGFLVLSRYSETVRGLLDGSDERIAGIDLRATAGTGVVLIVAILVAFIVSIARGESGWPYSMLGAVGGVAYVAFVVALRWLR